MKIVLGISGSIASYRSADVVKHLVASGHEVHCALTRGGQEFVTSKSLESFSGNPVMLPDMFGEGHFGTDHIVAARWADVFIIYGASANFIGRLANGLADDFLTLQLLAFKGSVIIAPAMNPAMWSNVAVVHNVARLKLRGYHIVEPVEGIVACGETGIGHVASDEAIIARMNSATKATPLPGLAGKTVLISAGPMRTALDPVRYIQNRSSGKMGLALAKACVASGAVKIDILLGPVGADMRAAFGAFTVHDYTSPADYDASLAVLFPARNVFFSAAAVLDFETIPQTHKLDRASFAASRKLEAAIRPVPDFVAKYAAMKSPQQKVIAFAAETGSESEIITRATAKMNSKKADAIIANQVAEGTGPDSDTNTVWIIVPDRAPQKIGPALKSDLGHLIVEALFSA